MIKLIDILKEIVESKKLNATGVHMDVKVLSKFTEKGKYGTNSSQRILTIEDTNDDPKTVAKDALNKWKEINNYLKQFDDGNKWFLRGIAMGYQEPEAEEIAKELLKLYPSGEIKKWNEDNIYFIFPLLDLQKGQLNEKKLCPKGRAYYNRRISAGEKPSAYLSGRAVKVCKGLMKEFLNEEIDPSEAYNDTDAIDTLVKRKRDLAFIVQGANTEENWKNIQKTIKDNDIRIMYVKGNPYNAYVAYLPGSENKATKLKDLAEKYKGYLSAQATKEDTIQIGRLLGYKEDKIKEYVNKNYPNDPMDESLEDTFWTREKGQKITLPQLLDAIKDYPIVQAPIEKVEKIIIKKNSGGIESDRLSAADIKYPIIIVVDNSGNYRYVLDGNHRANKAIASGAKSIPAKLVNIKKLPQEFQDVLNESLRDWFQKEDWVRIDTQGNITGPCGTMKKGKATTRCLPRAKANRLTKAERAATARKKVAGSKKGKQFVANTKKAKVKLNKENLDEMSLKQGLAAAGIALSTLLGTPDTSKASTPTSISQVAAKSIIEKVVKGFEKEGYKIDFLETAKYKNFDNAGEDDIKVEFGAAKTESAARLTMMQFIKVNKLDRNKTLFMFNPEEEQFIIIYTKK